MAQWHSKTLPICVFVCFVIWLWHADSWRQDMGDREMVPFPVLNCCTTEPQNKRFLEPRKGFTVTKVNEVCC